jgi:hypothetical protein
MRERKKIKIPQFPVKSFLKPTAWWSFCINSFHSIFLLSLIPNFLLLWKKKKMTAQSATHLHVPLSVWYLRNSWSMIEIPKSPSFQRNCPSYVCLEEQETLLGQDTRYHRSHCPVHFFSDSWSLQVPKKRHLIKNSKLSQATVAHICYPTYLGDRSGGSPFKASPCENRSWEPISINRHAW